MFRRVARPIRRYVHELRLPAAARNARVHDRRGLGGTDPGIDPALDEALTWLCRAQDGSRSQDGGVARHYGFVDGWAASYPETTGYIVPTFLEAARRTGRQDLRERARRMVDWLVSIQLPDGSFQGGQIDAEPRVPTTFNTGQILIGLAHATSEFGDAYREPMRRAADWLVESQDEDGCWRRHPTPFARPGEKTYETHVAWGLFEAARVDPERPYARAAEANVRWALTHQRDNGWFDRCCLTDPTQPLTHTLGYALRGVLEAYRFTKAPDLLEAGRRTADGLRTCLRDDGHLPGRLRSDWSGSVDWACLTGSVQIAHCWLLLWQDTGDARYRDAGFAANQYVRRTVKLDGPPETRGGVQGSFPIDGGYGTYQYLNWAAKFFVDSNWLEKDVREG